MNNRIFSQIALFSLFLILTSLFTLSVFAQPNSSQTKEFGWSLKRYENNSKKEKNSKKDKKSNDSLINTNQTDSLITNQTNSRSNIQTPDSNEDTIRIETNLVTNDVQVLDSEGKTVSNLKAGDFILSEDGVEQKIELFAYGENKNLPRSIVLIFHNGKDDAEYTRSNYEAARTLINKLSPQDKMAIVSTNAKLAQAFTNDKELLTKALYGLILNLTSGSYKYGDLAALLAVLNELFTEEDTRPIVVFQAYGAEIFHLKKDEDTQSVPEKTRKFYLERFGEKGFGFSDIKESIFRSRATIYSVYPGLRFIGLPREEQLRRSRIITQGWMQWAHGETDTNKIAKAAKKHEAEQVDNYIAAQSAIINVAKLSGGYTEFVERPEDAQKVYSTILDVINNRYTIGYYPANEARDGRLRKIKLEVRGHSEYRIVTRESYFAPKL